MGNERSEGTEGSLRAGVMSCWIMAMDELLA